MPVAPQHCCACCRRELFEDAEVVCGRCVSRMRGAGLTPKWVEMPFGQVPRPGQMPAWKAAVNWAAEKGPPGLPGLLLHGPHGVGKTHAAALAARVVATRRALQWMNIGELAFAFDLPFESAGYRDAHRMLLPARIETTMVLDDLTCARLTDKLSKALYVVVNRCVEYRLPLLVTTTSLPEALDGLLDPALASRLAEHCLAVPMSGGDRRRRPDGPLAVGPGPQAAGQRA